MHWDLIMRRGNVNALGSHDALESRQHVGIASMPWDRVNALKHRSGVNALRSYDALKSHDALGSCQCVEISLICRDRIMRWNHMMHWDRMMH